ncbi:PTS sugar transporter subunit IIA [Alicyclobacillus shizuokensis]|uniref:PTS sugar transporter subunit IIA n=1 Tax=Alicyclobacillus shizuokensis TaxID=392014 RepID=UPI00082E0F25|nr:PTS sugar transporter subunit IIA [Alicyclobacillus shizuokensis]MCL6625480.1 PTS sugar transporter subunit IIA [Alicyclobacillus shizuokensis]
MRELTEKDVLLRVPSEDKYDAIRRVGQKLVDNGYVEAGYIDGMIAREDSMTTYIGNGVAIPHGMPESVPFIRESGIVIAQYPQGVDFGDGKVARLVIGIAGRGEEHVEVLGKIATVCMEEDNVDAMANAADAKQILDIIRREGL